MPKVKIAIVGGGPKSAAIAAKANALNEEAGEDAFEVTIFEKGSVGENWTGGGSYTDGKQLLCTPAVRDVGYPYDSPFGNGVSKIMQERFSWMAFLVERGKGAYSRWIAADSTRPPHSLFAEYLKYVIDMSDATLQTGSEVMGLTARRGRWTVSVKVSGVVKDHPDDFDSVVFTGPGPARCVTPGFKHAGFFNGEDVWRRLDELKLRLSTSDASMLIIGGGGTAAAIAAWVLRTEYKNTPILFIAEQPTFYTRVGGYFENKAFDDDAMWNSLSMEQRRAFMTRTTRAVVWESVAGQLAAAENLVLIPGRASSISKSSDPDKIAVTYVPSNPSTFVKPLEHGIVIDASGFDTWWFKNKLPGSWAYKKTEYFEKKAAAMAEDLTLSIGRLPPIHAPTVSWAQGPGFSSLMVLGRMADRVLLRYVTTK